jgi:hypothetical protein
MSDEEVTLSDEDGAALESEPGAQESDQELSPSSQESFDHPSLIDSIVSRARWVSYRFE